MRFLKGVFIFIIFTLMLTGCAEVETSPTSTELTIEPYYLSDRESLLMSKTGVDWIAFFMLNGSLDEEGDLQFSVEVYENGEFKEEVLKTWGELETNYKDSIISAGINNMKDVNQSLQLISGFPSGRATTYYPNEMTASSFSMLIDEKITLEKNKPIYFAGWFGTTKGSLRAGGGENGELPPQIEDAELALVFKMVWTDQEH